MKTLVYIIGIICLIGIVYLIINLMSLKVNVDKSNTVTMDAVYAK